MEAVTKLAVENVSQLQSGRSVSKALSQQGSGDIFLMLIQNLIDGVSENTEGLEGMLLGNGSTKEEDTNLMQSFAGMMLQNPEILPVDIMQLLGKEQDGEQSTVDLISSIIKDTGGQQGGIDVLALLKNLPKETVTSELASQLTDLATATKTTAQPNESINDKFSIPILKAEYTESAQSKSDGEINALLAERQFRTTIDEVKQNLDARPKEEIETLGGGEKKQETKTEVLADTSTGKTEADVFPKELKATSEAKSAANPKPAEQVKDGIEENLALGKKEFVMKLKPESLGEITVRMIEKDGKTVLDIVTESASTAKKINDDISMLREAVKPMQVEVHEATHRTEAASQSELSQQFNMFSQQQQFENQQRAFYSQHGGTARSFNLNGELIDSLVAGQQEARVSLARELDTYV